MFPPSGTRARADHDHTVELTGAEAGQRRGGRERELGHRKHPTRTRDDEPDMLFHLMNEPAVRSYGPQNNSWSSRTVSIPIAGPKISSQRAIDPGGGGKAIWPS